MKKLTAFAATLCSLIIMFPIFYSISASFFSYADFTSIPARLLPSVPTLENYARAFKESNLERFLANSLFTASMGTVLRMTSALLVRIPSPSLPSREGMLSLCS